MSVRINHIVFTYLKKTKLAFKALDDVCFEIKDGSFTSIVGETGSGKSTLIQHLNGLLLPDCGEIYINDFVIDKKGNKKIKEIRSQVGLVFQFPEAQLFEETVIKDVCFGLKNFGYEDNDALSRAREALNTLGISSDKFERSPFELSGGERRRVALAGVLALKPKVLILDEPTVGLDPTGNKELFALLKTIKDSGVTIIAVSHDMNLVFALSDQVLMLDKGKVTFDGTREDFFKNVAISSFEKPDLLQVIETLKKYSMNIDISKVRDMSDLIREIKK